jgi:outer membrane protein TolC
MKVLPSPTAAPGGVHQRRKGTNLMNRVFWLSASLAAVVVAGCAAESFDADAYDEFAAANGYFGGRWVESDGEAAGRPTAEAELGDASQLIDYLAYAARHSPELKSAFAEWKAAVERLPQVTALPDPRFTFRHYIEEVETRVGPQRNAFELTQTFPWLGKLELRGDVAAEEAKAARYRFEAARLALFYRVHQAYDEYYYLGQAIDITETNVELLNQGEAVARRRYAVGAAEHPDVIRIQVEQGKLADRLRTLQSLRAPTMARLNAAMNRPVDAPLPWPREVPTPTADLTSQQLLAWAAQANPRVQALGRQIAAREHGIELAKKEYFPDVTVGAGFVDTGSADMPVDESGKDPVFAMVSVNIPIWRDRIAAGVREARWRKLRAVHDKAALLNNLGADLEMALFEFQDAGRKIGLYRDTLVPKAEQALQAAQAGYSTGATSFQDYLDAQRVLLEFQLSYQRALADRARRMAQLEMLVGRALPAEPARPALPE